MFVNTATDLEIQAAKTLFTHVSQMIFSHIMAKHERSSSHINIV